MSAEEKKYFDFILYDLFKNANDLKKSMEIFGINTKLINEIIKDINIICEDVKKA